MAVKFEDPTDYTIEPDSATHRTCSVCGARIPFENFYKDGKNSDGSTRHRRDCKFCYKKSRDDEKALKNPVVAARPVKKRGARKK